MKIRKQEIVVIIFFIFTLMYSFLKGLLVYNNIENFQKFFHEVISMTIVYLSFVLIMVKKEVNISKIFKTILYGYCFNNIFGLLQFIYVKYHISSILSINEFLLASTTHIDNGKIQFLFGEPSFIGTHITLVIIPIVLYLYQSKVKLNNFIKLNLILLIFLTIASNSLKVLLDILVALVVIFIMFKKLNFVKKTNVIACLLITMATFAFISDNVENNILIRRINNMIAYSNNDSMVRDYSSWARQDYSLVGFYSLRDNVIAGYGGGYYVEAYKKNIYLVDDIFSMNAELLRNINADFLNSINMYSRFCCEFGIIGVLILIYYIIVLYNRTHNSFDKIILLLILYNLIQNDSLGFVPMLFWIAYINVNSVKNIISIGENRYASHTFNNKCFRTVSM